MAEKGSGNMENNSSDDAVPGRTEQILCQPCSNKGKQTVADVFCSTCDEFQCTECSNVHTTHAFLRNHKLVNAKEVKTKQVAFDMNGFDQCDEHQNVLEFFCGDENQLCCSTCAIVDHRKCHSVVEIQKIAGKSASASSKSKVKLQEVREKAEKIVKNVKSAKEELDQDVKEVSLTIRRMRDNITSIDLKQTGDDVGEPLYSGLDFLPDGRLVAVDNKNKKCLIYNEKLKKVVSYQLSYPPKSVVAVSEEEVAITSANIYFLRVSKSNEITLIRTCKVKTNYDSICMKDERNFVVGTYDDTTPVRIVSLSGEEKDFNIDFLRNPRSQWTQKIQNWKSFVEVSHLYLGADTSHVGFS
ncbi:zinc-binding protein A33-like [Mercenaria mercenaria]|uniref:zinc-binding protein A33-like n=1 Tax=Mercenaria mercenaria TaxID=6596 RepID=UPI00234F0FA6|nr:zinc-binding protein A33-like [Mercenaria mercenaria]